MASSTRISPKRSRPSSFNAWRTSCIETLIYLLPDKVLGPRGAPVRILPTSHPSISQSASRPVSSKTLRTPGAGHRMTGRWPGGKDWFSIFIGRVAFHVNTERPVVAAHRTVDRIAGAVHAGDLREALLELLVKPVQLLRLISGQRGIYPHHQPALRFEPEALVLQVAQRLGQQARADQQNGGQRHLQHHQRPLRQR